MITAQTLAGFQLKNRLTFRGGVIVGASVGLTGGVVLGWVLPGQLLGLLLLASGGLVWLLGLLSRERRQSQEPTLKARPVKAEPAPKCLAHRPSQSQEIRCNPFFELLSSSSL
ncbi:hypothetical protein [Hymenobacter cellulosilyticus]|uniref:Uncharacterized protein n=1 Tax=Hymenobacter cellulosilyticus TaxID=2932248 RepID=A0A8T9Q8Y2_9BACT|nr:hypothetical protein [Hymenobacter cellulosilyticus]UOQ73954.1 hypothetical protein MUN79_08665 [Hymenobacter cellulosilyticus]